MKIDMHCHTSEGTYDAKISVIELIKDAKDKNMDAIIITDRESYEGFNYLKNNNIQTDIIVLHGFEYTSQQGDFIIVLPDEEDIIAYNYLMTASKLIDLVHSLNGVIGIAHMYKDCYSIGNVIKDTKQLEEIINLVDFIEVENGTALNRQNKKALQIAEKYKKKQSKGSDAHVKNECGSVFLDIPANIKCNKDLIAYYSM